MGESYKSNNKNTSSSFHDFSQKTLRSEYKWEEKNARVCRLEGRMFLAGRAGLTECLRFNSDNSVMSLKFIDDKIGEIGFKAKYLGEVTITVILF